MIKKLYKELYKLLSLQIESQKTMKTPKFSIRKSIGQAQVYYSIYVAGQRLIGKTDVVVDTRYWKPTRVSKGEDPIWLDFTKAARLGKAKEATLNDRKLRDFITWYTECKFKDYEGNEIPIRLINDKEELRNEVEIYYGRRKREDGRTTLKDYFEEHIVYLEHEKKVKRSTIYYYKRTEGIMKEFCKVKKKPFSYETFTNKNILQLKQYLTETYGYKDNTWNLYLTCIKSVMGRSYDLEYHDVRQYRVAKPIEVKKFDIYLTEKEVQAIRDIDLTDKTDIAVRDYFVLMCRTGERVADVIGGKELAGDEKGKLKRVDVPGWSFKNIEEKGTLRIRMRAMKTGKSRYFSVTDETLEILERWSDINQLPHPYGFPNDRGMNITHYLLTSRIRKIAEKAGITDDIQGKPKYKWITPHTSRRTAVTLAYLDGMEIEDIRRKITLHKDDKTTLNYIKANNSEIESEMRERGDVA